MTATSKAKPKTAPAASASAGPATKAGVATRTGVVRSDKRAKTRTVEVPNLVTHPKYGKIIRKRTVLQVHDEQNTSALGDLVEVAPCRPVSRSKSWTLVRVVEKGVGLGFEGVAAPGQDKA